MMLIKRKFVFPFSNLFIIAFMEGAVVMAVEIVGAKMIVPYYGASLVVWTSVIGVTLISLALGYFLGGQLSTLKFLKTILFYLFSISALWIGFMPLMGVFMLTLFQTQSIYSGTIYSALSLFSFPLILLGSSTPIIIKLLTTDLEVSGKNSGLVFAISTIGGIVMTFALGFYIIPVWGISKPIFLISLGMIAISIVILYSNYRLFMGLIILVFFIKPMNQIFINAEQTKSKSFLVHYKNEGLMGQLKVYDENLNENAGYSRYLLVNGIPQTFINLQTGVSYFFYVHMISVLSTIKPAGSNVLMLGFGGGSLASELVEHKFKIDAVDIDKRMMYLAKTFFEYNDQNTQFYVDDARHYIKNTNNKYDLIILDMLVSEVQPSYMFSKEAFQELQQIMNPNGLVIINFQGFMTKNDGSGFRSIFRTLKASGFNDTKFIFTNCEKSNPCDIVFVASIQPFDISGLNENNINSCCLEHMEIVELIDKKQMNSIPEKGVSYILVDDKPMLEHLNNRAIRLWRESMIKNLAQKELQEGLRPYK